MSLFRNETRAWDAASEESLRACVQSGYSCREAADLLDRGETTIRRKVSELGIQFRPAKAHPHQALSGGRNIREADQLADYLAGDERHIEAVLKANVYGFPPNTKILARLPGELTLPPKKTAASYAAAWPVIDRTLARRERPARPA